MRTFRHAIALSVVVLSMLVVTGPAAKAASPSSAVCSITVVVDFTPGFTVNPAAIHLSSGGETGRVDCVGEVRGAPVSGPGAYGVEGFLTGVLGGATCAQESGSGIVSMTIPTTAGAAKLTEPVSFERVGLNGTARTPSFSGAFQAVPLVGDCVTTPVTKVLVLTTGILTS